MLTLAPNWLAQTIFRSNPEYELIPVGDLSSEQRALLRGAIDTTQTFAVLSPIADKGLGVKSVSLEIAELFQSMRTAGALPVQFHQKTQFIIELILDNFLEFDIGAGFVSGADAYGRLFGQRAGNPPTSRIGRISEAAVKYAQVSSIREVGKLSARMYFFGRFPASPQWTQRFPPWEETMGRLGLQLQEGASGGFVPSRRTDGWVYWESTRFDKKRRRGAWFKLYISPHPEHLHAALSAATSTLRNCPVTSFKMGENVFGLLRPDKCVAYFSCFADLQETANRLKDKLKGIPAHGVPFTAELYGDGLISWGADPPPAETPLEWQERQSWRLWVTSRLARHVLAARGARVQSMEPWMFAIRRMELEGIDPSTWAPTNVKWLKS
jgi:hypothetical protein